MTDVKHNLCELAEQQQLVNRAIASCKTWLNNSRYRDDDTVLIAEFAVDDIEFRFDKQSLVFKNRKLDYEYIDTQLGLYVNRTSGELHVGHYRLITTLDGEAVDDYLIFYPDHDVQAKRENVAG